MTDIEKNLSDVGAKIKVACAASGREEDSVTLVAVSKRHPVSAIERAYRAGQRHFGENYAKELRDKAEQLEDLPQIKWHFIGHLQRNKAKWVAPSVHMTETVDSLRLIEELERQAGRTGRLLSCLVQVNVGQEEQKSGCDEGEVGVLLEALSNAKGLEAAGLMTIPPWDLEAEETRRYFVSLAALREKLGGAKTLPHLSMGMSHDFEVAIEEGATLVRVGTAIFGPRPV